MRISILAVLALTGCSTVAQAPARSDLSAQDLSALTAGYQLIQFDLLECRAVSGAQLSGNVAAVAAKLCADATRYEPTLTQLAAAHEVTLPDALPDDLNARYVAFHYGPTGQAFLRDQISSHEDALAVFQLEAASGTNPELKGVAGRIMPVVQGNLDALRAALGSQE
jgi:predicted outer membrane protein